MLFKIQPSSNRYIAQFKRDELRTHFTTSLKEYGLGISVTKGNVFVSQLRCNLVNPSELKIE